MDVDPREQSLNLPVNNINQIEANEHNAMDVTPTDQSSTSRGEVHKILDQTIHDGGAVKYTVLWENGDTTEESVEALGKWDDLVQEYEHSQFSKSEVKTQTNSPPPSRKSQQFATNKSDSDGSKRGSSTNSRPARSKARANVQYYEEESDDAAEYSGSRSSKKPTTKSKKPASSGDDAQDQDQDTTVTLSARGYPRRSQQAIKPQPTLESSDESSDEMVQSKTKTERKPPSAPKTKKVLVATSTDSSFVQAHHPFCTRCGQRGEITKKKSKKRSDDEEDDEPLGSLLLCECCSAGYHRLCLRKTYTDSLIGTGFRCESCIKNKGAECLECHEWVGRNPIESIVKTPDTTAQSPPTKNPETLPASEETTQDKPGEAKSSSMEAPDTVDSEASKDMEVEKDTTETESSPKADSPSESVQGTNEVLFRCFRCTYTAHDKCLKHPASAENSMDRSQIIKYYRKDWKCHQCLEWDRELDLILAFRDVPIHKSNSSTQDIDTEMVSADSVKPEDNISSESSKDGSTFPQAPDTTRELLVKWKNMSYRKVTWVPSYWVSQVVSSVKIKTFWKKTVGPVESVDVIRPQWTQVEKILDVTFDQDYEGAEDDMDALDHIQSVFVKWKDLEYDQATWDDPDEPDSPDYPHFKQAFKDWVAAQKIEIPARAKKGRSGLQPRSSTQHPFEELKEQPSYISGGTLKDYQMDGLNWLRYNHWKNVNSILADEMGLGKTIQMVAFVTTLFHQLRAFPCLIVVPNSTLTNWVREFAKWAPDLRVVPYYGPQTSRSVVRDYELFHRGTQDLKCHVVVTTYEMIVNPTDGALFRKNSWECLVVDEGQRLKNENSMLFVKLNELAVENRVLLTGTPLQNNIRELFSLMNFLDPVKFSDVTELEKKYENLDKTAVEELHGLLKPFFLRRTKDEVLKDLPPKSEVIVPVGMSPLQKEIYKGILARNHKLLQSITNRGGTASNRKASLHNILMELRKCLNHPYLIDGVEPRYLETAELVHKSLIEAGGKLELLHNMLPKLKQNGHRVLIFSTMTRLLDILEDYLNGEHYNFVRLDGSTSSSDRQARIDKFNAPNSDVFVFLLSTRAGGVGVNLATADTIIIYDVDFNPKADMQALSRAHRIGQKNKVLVLKFMTRNSAEERIVQIGKKKMILDHLIVERMEDDNLDPVDVESILKFGAKALFEEDSNTNEDLKYDDAALEALLDRSKIEHNWDETDNGDTKVGGFGFAKVWTETKGVVDEDIPIEAPPETEEEGFWSTLLRDRLAMAYAQEEETLGRGARRKTVMSYAENGNGNEGPPNKKRKAGKEAPSKEEEDYVDQDLIGSDIESVDSDPDVDPNSIMGELDLGKRQKKNRMPQDPNQPQIGEMGMDVDVRQGPDGFTQDANAGQGGKTKKARIQSSPYQGQQATVTTAGGRAMLAIEAANRKAGRKPLPCLVCNRSHRDRCAESQDIPLVLERRQQIATSNYPEDYKNLALATLDRFLLDKQITPAELPKGKTARNLSAAAARLGGAAYQDSLRSMSIGKAFVPTITPGACIVCNQTPYHLPFNCSESRNVQFMQERCRNITLDPTIPDVKKQEYVSNIKGLIARESPRGNPPPTSAAPSSRRTWGTTGNPPSSTPRTSSTGPGAPMQGGGGLPSASSKHPSSGQRSSHNHGHQAYSSQIPAQFMSSRPKEQLQGSAQAPSSAQGASRIDPQRQRDYNSGYQPRNSQQPHTSAGHLTSGARESSNYQPRKPAYRNDDGSIVTPTGRGSGYSSAGGRGSQEYSNESSQSEYSRERDRSGYTRPENSRHDPYQERERIYNHPEGRVDDLPRGQQDYSRTDNGPYSHDRTSQHHSNTTQSSNHYQDQSSHTSQHYRQSQSSSQSQHQSQHLHQQQHGYSSSRPRTDSMSPRDEHRVIGQQAVPSSQYTMEQHVPRSQHDTSADLVMTSPTHDSTSSLQSQNGEIGNGQIKPNSPGASPPIGKGNLSLNERNITIEARETSPTYPVRGGLATAAREMDQDAVHNMKKGSGYGSIGLKERYHPLRTGEASKMDLASEREEDDIPPEVLAAELRINEPHHTFVE